MTESIVLISSAEDCNIKRFRRCKFKSDYDCLVISGKPTDEEKLKAFEKINDEFVSLCGFPLPEISMLTGIYQHQIRNECVNILVMLLESSALCLGNESNDVFDRCLEDIKTYGHRLKHNPGDLPGFLEQIEKVKTKEVKHIDALNTRKKEYQTFTERKDKDGLADSLSEQSFTKLLTQIDRFMGFKIDQEKESVEYLANCIFAYQESVKNHLDQLNKESKKQVLF